MTENRSIDDFLGGDAATDGKSDGDDELAEDADGPPAGGGSTTDVADGPAGNAGDAPGDDAAEGEETDDVPDVSPAVGTYRWDPSGVACPACGDTVERLWLDDGRQVCADCKQW